MELSLDTLVTALWFVLFCFMVWITVELPKRPLEKWKPWLKENFWWNDVGMPAAPVALGIIYALVMRKYPFLVDQSSEAVRVGLGATAGFLSAYVVRVAKKRLKDTTGLDVDPESKSS